MGVLGACIPICLMTSVVVQPHKFKTVSSDMACLYSVCTPQIERSLD